MIVALEHQPVPAVVALLRDLLERAERGEVQTIVVATEAIDRCIGTASAGELDLPRMLGALEIAKLRIMQGVEV